MDVFRPEVHALFLSPFLDELRSVLGDAEVLSLVDSFGITEESLRDKEAWVSDAALPGHPAPAVPCLRHAHVRLHAGGVRGLALQQGRVDEAARVAARVRPAGVPVAAGRRAANPTHASAKPPVTATSA